MPTQYLQAKPTRLWDHPSAMRVNWGSPYATGLLSAWLCGPELRGGNGGKGFYTENLVFPPGYAVWVWPGAPYTIAQGPFLGSAISLPGSANYFAATAYWPAVAELTTMSIVAWSTDLDIGVASNERYLLAKHYVNQGWAFGANSNPRRLFYKRCHSSLSWASVAQASATLPTLTTTSWQQVGMSYVASGTNPPTFYCNGAALTSTFGSINATAATSIQDTNVGFGLGGDWLGSGNEWKGKLNIILLYGRALSADDFRALYRDPFLPFIIPFKSPGPELACAITVPSFWDRFHGGPVVGGSSTPAATYSVTMSGGVALSGSAPVTLANLVAYPSTLDYFRAGEVVPFINGKVNTDSLDFFQYGEFIPAGVIGGVFDEMSGGVIVGGSVSPGPYVDWGPTMDGGPVITGSSDAPDTAVVYNVDASGGVILGGSISPVIIAIMDGGVVVGGSANPAELIVGHTASGGPALSGVAPNTTVYDNLDAVSGGVVVGGTSPAGQVFNVTADVSGPIVGDDIPPGPLLVEAIYNPAMTGSLVIGSAATLAISVQTGGGPVVGGQAVPAATYNNVGASEGGVTVGGAATVTTVYVTIISGGVIVEGVSPPTMYFFPRATGGVIVEGVSPPETTYTPAASGGALIGGSSTIAMTYDFTASGGATLGDSFPLGQVVNFTFAGGVTVGSSATVTATYPDTMSGGVHAWGSSPLAVAIAMAGGPVLGSSAPMYTRFAPTASGGVTASGEASIALGVTASGGPEASGTAGNTADFAPSMTGGPTATGTAGLTATFVPQFSGGPTLGGTVPLAIGISADGGPTVGSSATLAATYATSASGGATLGGTSPLSISILVGGNLTIGSSSPPTIQYAPVASGGVTLGSTATATLTYVTVASGGVTVSGSGIAAPVYEWTIAGGVTVGSSAPVTLTFTPAATGGPEAGGSASVAIGVVATGGVTAGGSATQAFTFAPSATGGVLLGSPAPVALVYTPTMTGGPLVTGVNQGGFLWTDETIGGPTVGRTGETVAVLITGALLRAAPRLDEISLTGR